ncbi:hypothetical protein DPEC_G00121810 [Dallia pectoralis]|uniref:Uncharacterized protein n=1 Tax=Dallia pectoralis TaxID=75939 RepID=A0ACC2GQ80_DALPE|nr:hypothetical protein DPEC_G00121810 [Dallia pectoralis]
MSCSHYMGHVIPTQNPTTHSENRASLNPSWVNGENPGTPKNVYPSKHNNLNANIVPAADFPFTVSLKVWEFHVQLVDRQPGRSQCENPSSPSAATCQRGKNVMSP